MMRTELRFLYTSSHFYRCSKNRNLTLQNLEINCGRNSASFKRWWINWLTTSAYSAEMNQIMPTLLVYRTSHEIIVRLNSTKPLRKVLHFAFRLHSYPPPNFFGRKLLRHQRISSVPNAIHLNFLEIFLLAASSLPVCTRLLLGIDIMDAKRISIGFKTHVFRCFFRRCRHFENFGFD